MCQQYTRHTNENTYGLHIWSKVLLLYGLTRSPGLAVTTSHLPPVPPAYLPPACCEPPAAPLQKPRLKVKPLSALETRTNLIHPTAN